MIGKRSRYGAGSAVLVIALLLPGASASPAVGDEPDTDAHVRVVHAISTLADVRLTVRASDRPLGRVVFAAATRFTRRAGGVIDVAVLSEGRTVARGAVEAAPGCYYTIVAAQPSGLSSPPQLLTFSDCLLAREAVGRSSLRLLLMSADAGPVELVATGATTGAVALPFELSERITASSGKSTVKLHVPRGTETFATKEAELVDGASYTVLYAGGGETPLAVSILLDGKQPPTPPDPQLPIDTGDGLRSTPTIIEKASADRSRRADRATEIGTPMRVEIPAIGIDATIVALASNTGPDLPRLLDGATVAWFDGTNRPGDIGTAFLVGHVEYHGAPGVFAELSMLHRGDTIVVDDAAGRRRKFVVRSTGTYAKRNLPADLYGMAVEPTVVLISCAGPVDPTSGLRTQNVVVVATA